jgi:hypothetical protein
MQFISRPVRHGTPALVLILALAIGLLATPGVAGARGVAPPTVLAADTAAAASSDQADSLEGAASRASEVGRTIAFSLIGLALAVAGVLLVFRRDFKEAVGVLAIGVIAVMLASPIGLTVLQDTVSVLFGSG